MFFSILYFILIEVKELEIFWISKQMIFATTPLNLMEIGSVLSRNINGPKRR